MFLSKFLDAGFIMVNTGDPSSFWTQLFSRFFLSSSSSGDDSRDDMIFYVRKSAADGKFILPKVSLHVFVVVVIKSAS